MNVDRTRQASARHVPRSDRPAQPRRGRNAADPARQLDGAIALHQSGRLIEAERRYLEILRKHPGYPDATHLLGLVRHQQGRPREALELIDRALKIIPLSAAAQGNRGAALQALGRFEEAIASYDRALSLRPADAQVLCNRGHAMFELHRFGEALASLDEALAIRPAEVAAWHKRGDVLMALGRPQEAIASHARALAICPGQVSALIRHSDALKGLSRFDEALAALDQILELKPDSAEVLSRRGNLLLELDRPAEALECYDRALAISPDLLEATNNRGNALGALKRFEEALSAYDRALEIRPNFVGALNNRATALMALKRREEALKSLDQALAVRPDFADALNNRGNVFHEMQRHEQALEAYDRAIAIQPDFAAALNNRGNTLRDLKRFDDALQCFDKAINLKPDYAEAISNRGNVLRDLDQIDEALWSYRRALELKADYANPLSNLGNALVDLGRFDEATTNYDRAVALEPENADYRLNRSLLLLRRGASDGWREYESRRRTKNWIQRSFTGPEWTGESISGKRVLLYGEQGLGDTIQFSRFASSVAELGADVILEVQPPIAALLRRIDGGPSIMRQGDAAPPYDFHVPLMSVPFVLGLPVEPSAAFTPYLSADPDRIRRWAPRLPAEGLRVGIAWQGNPKSPIEKGRSLPLKAFAALNRVPGLTLISLQKGSGAEQLASLPTGMRVETLGPGFDVGSDAFLDTAAVMMNLDLIVTCDTAIAHLAGALGRPVWILLKSIPDWRWMSDRETTPWYPTARLFRQARAGDWDEVLSRVAAALVPLAAAPPMRTVEEDLCEDAPLDLAWLLDRALTHHQNTRFAEAEHLYLQIRQSDPDHFDASHMLGVLRHQQGRNLEAVELIGAALENNPGSAPALVNLGAALSVLGRHEEALTRYDAALAVAPNWAEALLNRGNALLELRRFEEALLAYDRAIEARPNYLTALDGRGRALLELRRPNEALASFDKILDLEPGHPNALHNRGNAFVALAQQDEASATYERALASYDEVIARKPDHAEALYSRGAVLLQLRRVPEALSSFDRALAIRSDYADALCGRGNALKELDELEDALASYEAALAVRPDHVEALCNRGNALAGVRRFAEALASYDRAIEIDSENAELRFNRGYLLLLLGRFGEGWREHEWRRRKKTSVERHFVAPEWAGDDVRGKRVLLYSEQGMGDTIQFARFARTVAQLGAKVILEAQPRLVSLLRGLDCEVSIVPRGDELPEFDRHLPLMSVPFVLGVDVESKAEAAPYLSADPARVERWASQLPDGGFRVGVVWQGNASGPIDKGRSIPLRAFAPLCRIPGVKLVGLQKGAGREQVADLPTGMMIETLEADFDAGDGAFLDTAAIMMNLDLIVTSDTAVAHLAGALGRPVWIVLKHIPDWRWMIDREGSPWYPTARLFRQSRSGDWDEVFARIALELATLASGNAHSELPRSDQRDVCKARASESLSPASQQPRTEPTLPERPPAGFLRLLDKAMALHQKGKFADAERVYLTILASQPDHLDATHLLGLIRHQQGRDLEALELIDSVLKRSPDSAPALTNQGAVLYRLGRRAEAVASYDRALKLRPDDAKSLCNRGIALRELNRLDEAQESFERAIAAAPREWEAHVGLAHALKAKGRLDEAVGSWEHAVALNPHHETLNDLGNALMAIGRLDEAAQSYRHALAVRPDYAAAWTNLGAALAEQGEAEAAVAAHRRALAQSPSLVEAHANLVVALSKQGELEEAVAAAEHGIAFAPNFAPLHFGLGYALKEKGDIDAAVVAYRRALALQPDFPEGHFNLAFALLLKQHDADGWREYEWRWKGGVKGKVPRRLPGAQWQGEELAGRTLLLYAEQGRGDTFQFVRFVPHLTARGARVVFEAPRSLVALLQCSDVLADSVCATGEPLPHYDFHLPLLSVPAVLGMSEGTIPANAPYLAADPARAKAWKSRLGDNGFKIGVAWQGEPNAKVDTGRSFPLRALAPVATLPGVRLISLQKHHGLEQIDALPDSFRIETLEPDFDAGTDAFLDTAAVMMNLDLIITSDTAVAHLAGALGRPVWIVLKKVPDWRWLLDRDDSPWYPTARLFRQTRAGDWDEVFERLAGELARLNSEAAPRTSTSAAVSIPVPIGELVDKITILRIKTERIADLNKLANVERELALLDEVRRRCAPAKVRMSALESELETINRELWDIEDRIRDCEHHSDFGAEFVALARAVYMTNDRRSAVKRRISELAGSTLIEEKSYH